MYLRFCIASFAALVLSGCGSSLQVATSPTLPPAPPHVAITVSPAAVQPGQVATLTWSTFNAATCTASGDWKGSQQTTGSQSIMLPGAKGLSFTLACTGAGGSATQTASLNVAPPPIACSVKPAMVPRADRRVSRHRKPVSTSGL